MFQFGDLVSDLSGTKLAVWVTSYRKGAFDGVKVNSSPTLFIYDVLAQRRISWISIRPAEGQWDVAFSPDGGSLAVYDGARLNIYAVGDGISMGYNRPSCSLTRCAPPRSAATGEATVSTHTSSEIGEGIGSSESTRESRAPGN